MDVDETSDDMRSWAHRDMTLNNKFYPKEQLGVDFSMQHINTSYDHFIEISIVLRYSSHRNITTK